ncbi:MAG: hypothetical protein JNK75_15295 [Betaproteobacteria bacterium]|nr:hypothetical protein [Betaproteobacteria bacterium]
MQKARATSARHCARRAWESDAALTMLIENYGQQDSCAAQISHLYASRGDADNAFRWLERGFAQRDARLAYLIAVPFFDPIKHDPRWPTFVKKIGFDT